MDSVELDVFNCDDTRSSYNFATIEVGVPVMFAVAEFLGIKKNDPSYTAMAKRWSKAIPSQLRLVL